MATPKKYPSRCERHLARNRLCTRGAAFLVQAFHANSTGRFACSEHLASVMNEYYPAEKHTKLLVRRILPMGKVSVDGSGVPQWKVPRKRGRRG